MPYSRKLIADSSSADSSRIASCRNLQPFVDSPELNSLHQEGLCCGTVELRNDFLGVSKCSMSGQACELNMQVKLSYAT